LGGAGTTGTSVFLGKPGIGMFGNGMPGSPGTVVVGVLVVEVIGGPGWVVIATVPGVVRSHPVVRLKRSSAAAAVTRTCVFIP
jgi:hypothetical protein